MRIAWMKRRRSNATIRPIVANAIHNGAKSVMNQNRRTTATISVRSSHSASTATDKQMTDKWTRTRRQWYACDDDDDNRSIDTDTVHLLLLSHIPDSIWRREIWEKQIRNVGCGTATRQLQSLIYYKPIWARFASARLQLWFDLWNKPNDEAHTRCDSDITDPNANTFMRHFIAQWITFWLFFCSNINSVSMTLIWSASSPSSSTMTTPMNNFGTCENQEKKWKRKRFSTLSIDKGPIKILNGN